MSDIDTILAALPSTHPVAGLEELIAYYTTQCNGNPMLYQMLTELRALAVKQVKPQPPVVLCSCGLPAMNSEEGKTITAFIEGGAR